MLITGKDTSPLLRRDLRKAVRIIADAFIDYPIPGSFIEERDKRFKALREMFKVELKFSLRHSFVRTLPGEFKEVAIFRHNTEIIKGKKYIPYASISTLGMMFYISGREMKKLDMAVSKIERVKKTLTLPEKTAELYILAVSPNHQGEGRASKLLRPILNELKEQGISCLLMTNKEVNCRIYEKLGFKIIEELFDPRFNLTTYYMLRNVNGDAE
jgi:ribosomal protein S18 acetylase RimI-like enzyme